jgi:hypothetical protein
MRIICSYLRETADGGLGQQGNNAGGWAGAGAGMEMAATTARGRRGSGLEGTAAARRKSVGVSAINATDRVGKKTWEEDDGDGEIL